MSGGWLAAGGVVVLGVITSLVTQEATGWLDDQGLSYCLFTPDGQTRRSASWPGRAARW